MKSSVKNKAIWLIAYPIIFGNLAQTLITLTDTAFLGRVSNIALGASMMAGIYYYVYSTLAWGFAIGIQIIVARRLGEKRLERIGVIFEHGLVFVLSLSILSDTALLHCRNTGKNHTIPQYLCRSHGIHGLQTLRHYFRMFQFPFPGTLYWVVQYKSYQFLNRTDGSSQYFPRLRINIRKNGISGNGNRRGRTCFCLC